MTHGDEKHSRAQCKYTVPLVPTPSQFYLTPSLVEDKGAFRALIRV